MSDIFPSDENEFIKLLEGDRLKYMPPNLTTTHQLVSFDLKCIYEQLHLIMPFFYGDSSIRAKSFSEFTGSQALIIIQMCIRHIKNSLTENNDEDCDGVYMEFGKMFQLFDVIINLFQQGRVSKAEKHNHDYIILFVSVVCMASILNSGLSEEYVIPEEVKESIKTISPSLLPKVNNLIGWRNTMHSFLQTVLSNIGE